MTKFEEREKKLDERESRLDEREKLLNERLKLDNAINNRHQLEILDRQETGNENQVTGTLCTCTCKRKTLESDVQYNPKKKIK